jgi:hypothetical protein
VRFHYSGTLFTIASKASTRSGSSIASANSRKTRRNAREVDPPSEQRQQALDLATV